MQAATEDIEMSDARRRILLSCWACEPDIEGLDPTTSDEALRSLAERGDARAQKLLGWRAMGAATLAGETPIEETRWLLVAAEQGDAHAAHLLAWCYDDGTGMPVDVNAAAIWFRTAAERGHGGAMMELAVRYALGSGVNVDDAHAFSYCSAAAELGVRDALPWLANMYRRGQGVPRNAELAVQWTKRAADAGFATSQWLVARDAWARGRRDEAERYFRQAYAGLCWNPPVSLGLRTKEEGRRPAPRVPWPAQVLLGLHRFTSKVIRTPLLDVDVWSVEPVDVPDIVEAALDAIRVVRPSEWKRFQRLVDRIAVEKSATTLGRWDKKTRTIWLSEHTFALRPRGYWRMVVRIGATIVHEITHARIDNLGLSKYSHETERLREERICQRAALVFARRAPEGASAIAETEESLKVWTAATFTNLAFFQRSLTELASVLAPVEGQSAIGRRVNHLGFRAAVWVWRRGCRKLNPQRRAEAERILDAQVAEWKSKGFL